MDRNIALARQQGQLELVITDLTCAVEEVMAFDETPETWPRWFTKIVRDHATGIEPQWVGGWYLGEGGQGIACLWCQFDYRNRVADVSAADV